MRMRERGGVRVNDLERASERVGVAARLYPRRILSIITRANISPVEQKVVVIACA